MIPRATIETAYAFFHQKERVYAYSNMEWQKDDIEYAISQYVHDMDSSSLPCFPMAPPTSSNLIPASTKICKQQ